MRRYYNSSTVNMHNYVEVVKKAHYICKRKFDLMPEFVSIL